MAFVVAGVVALGTIGWVVVMLFASGMSDSPSASREVDKQAAVVLNVGIVVAVLIAASHWAPPIRW